LASETSVIFFTAWSGLFRNQLRAI